MPAYKSLPPELITVGPAPADPARLCEDDDRNPTVCNGDLATGYDAMRAWGRGLAAQIAKIAGLQP